MGKDLRVFLADLEKAGQLLRVKKTVDVDREMGALNWEAIVHHKKALMCENIDRYSGWKTVSGITGSRENMAVALGTSIKDCVPVIAKRMRETRLSPCPVVKEGSCQEIVKTGKNIDLNEIPFNVVQERDAGRYLGSGCIVVRDPETGIRNMSIQRHQIKGKDKLGIMMVAGRHCRMVYEKYQKQGKPMPCAIWIGHHGATVLASTWTTAFGVDELEIAQVLLNEPLELVKCKTVDLEVPASAEVVIEGVVPPDILEDEGPFGEHTGCTIAGAGKNEIVQVKAITMRKNPILFQITEGPNTDGAILDSIPMEVELFNQLKDVGGYVKLHNVVVHECAGGGHFVIIQLTPRVDGEVKGVLMAALSSNYLHHKIAVAVDDDVDPFDPSEIIWSISTKLNPVDDVFIISGTRGHSLDSSLPRISPKGVNPVIRVGSRMGIDATKPPLSRPEDRADFDRIFPRGYGKIKLEDFLKP
jgi:2,5-furandicarboxylate decarboxylase 1